MELFLSFLGPQPISLSLTGLEVYTPAIVWCYSGFLSVNVVIQVFLGFRCLLGLSE